MAFNPVKVPANIGAVSANAGGNQGFYTPVYAFQYMEGGAVTARAATLVAFSPTNCTLIGIAGGVAQVGSTNTTLMPLSIRGASLVGSTQQLCSSNAIIIGSNAGVGPAYTATIAWQGQTAQTTAFITSSSGGVAASTTNILPAVLGALANRQFSQGDAVAISTSGGMSSVAGIAATFYLRDDNGAY